MKITVSFILIGILMIGVFSVEVWANPDGALTERFSVEGRYDIVANGVGLFGTTSGNIPLNVPGTVVKAFLYWAGFENSSSSDDTVSFSIDGGAATSLTADHVFGPDFWWGFDTTEYYHFVYVENVTPLILTGSHTYNVSDVAMEHNYGAGLMVVYKDPYLPYSIVKILDGLDSAHFQFTPPQGPNTNVTCIQFDDTSDYRDMNITLFVGGVQNDTRANAIWYQTGTGAKPTNLVGEADATMLDGPPYPYPLGAYDGEEWDTYINNIIVQPDDTRACIQIESVENYTHLGASVLLISSAFVLRAMPPVGGIIIPVNLTELLAPWIILLSLIAVVSVAVIARKRHLVTPQRARNS